MRAVGGDAAVSEARSVRNICLVVEYEGTNFSGWQLQRSGRTVQGELERALNIMLCEPVRITGSGRTDAGTHARGQVAHFHTTSRLSTERLRLGLNGLLSADLAVRRVVEVEARFHARYSAKRKRYSYRLHQGKAALARRFVWCIHRPLDPEAMRVAAADLLGTHAFGAFCKQDPVPLNLECTVFDVQLSTRGAELILEIEANRFLRHMVRIIVGTLVEVGTGRRDPGAVRRLLQGGNRTAAGQTAPARGLHLLWVDYPGLPSLRIGPGH